MIVLQTMAVAFAMFSALPVPQFTWNSKKHAVRPLRVPSHRGGVIGALWSLCGALPLPDMIRAGGFCLIPVLVTGGIHLDGYADTSGRPFQLWRPGKEAGNFKRPPLRGLCRHPALHLLPRIFLRCVLHPLLPGWVVLDAGAGAGARPLGAGGGGVPHGQKTLVWPTPLPRRQTGKAFKKS